jgi:hypothetical protein
MREVLPTLRKREEMCECQGRSGRTSDREDGRTNPLSPRMITWEADVKNVRDERTKKKGKEESTLRRTRPMGGNGESR